MHSGPGRSTGKFFEEYRMYLKCKLTQKGVRILGRQKDLLRKERRGRDLYPVRGQLAFPNAGELVQRLRRRAPRQGECHCSVFPLHYPCLYSYKQHKPPEHLLELHFSPEAAHHPLTPSNFPVPRSKTT